LVFGDLVGPVVRAGTRLAGGGLRGMVMVRLPGVFRAVLGLPVEAIPPVRHHLELARIFLERQNLLGGGLPFLLDPEIAVDQVLADVLGEFVLEVHDQAQIPALGQDGE
jgi:hypothetical protein